ncbi:high-potential iron-sulfur protein [Halorhodospira halophila]|uniref:high-potential iron-sulfur protein n=2 Tax=Ectothiorhodospiraceae TaxID=72276 RepID=UPI001A936B48|nr:high-potential iron-sulfur protein [Halorhodospira halophila]MBK5936456.1 hypothetical protein [Halorhodospira halophila]MBK5943936.1 hypothetical protein [Halorhodospira halophila]
MMSKKPCDRSRRKFLRLGLMSTAAIPAASLFGSKAMADDNNNGNDRTWEIISEDAPEAKGIGYVHNQADADMDHPRFESHQFCANCLLYVPHEEDGDHGYCAAFGMDEKRLVNANGWCWAWEDAGDAAEVGPRDVPADQLRRG